MDNWILTKFNSRWIYISVKVYWNDSKSSNYMWLLQILVYAWSHWWLWPLREFTVLARKYTFSPATWICGNIYLLLHIKHYNKNIFLTLFDWNVKLHVHVCCEDALNSLMTGKRVAQQCYARDMFQADLHLLAPGLQVAEINAELTLLTEQSMTASQEMERYVAIFVIYWLFTAGANCVSCVLSLVLRVQSIFTVHLHVQAKPRM